MVTAPGNLGNFDPEDQTIPGGFLADEGDDAGTPPKDGAVHNTTQTEEISLGIGLLGG